MYKLVLSFATIVALGAPLTYAFDRGGDWGWRERHREDRAEFFLGACVGATLDQQGITLPNPPTALDSATQDALTAAIQTCRAQLSGASPTPSPSPSDSPSPTASATPTPTPTASSSPAPTASVTPTPSASPDPTASASPDPTTSASPDPTSDPTASVN